MCRTNTEPQGHRAVGQACTWDAWCLYEDWDCPLQAAPPTALGVFTGQSTRLHSLSLLGAMTLSPTLLCSRSFHSSRAAIQDHHRDHRGGAVGALFLLLRWVGDQLHSKGNNCQPAQQSSLETLNLESGLAGKALPSISLSPSHQRHEGHFASVWV